MQPFGIGLFPEGRADLAPGLLAYPVNDSQDRRVATVYGTLLEGWTGDGITVSGGAVRTTFPVADIETLEDRVHPGLAGFFVLEALAPLPRRLYIDCGGNLPLVWCEETGRAGSTAALILTPEEERQRFDRDRWQRLVVSEGSGWISGTLTAHRGLRRLLPGHWLDRDRLTTGRFWPRPRDLEATLDLEQGAQQIARAMKGMIEAIVRERRAAISLTAGFDSRILLAASRDVAGLTSFYTVPVDAVDAELATRMTRTLNVRHQMLPLVTSTREQAEWWDHAVGYCVREGNRDGYNTLGRIDADVVINGAFGEPGRGRLYKRETGQINQRRIDAASILARLTIPASPEHMAEVEQWLAPLQGWMAPAQLLDLAYIELRGASWAMAQAPAQKAVKWTFAPFAQRAIFDAFLRVPPEIKGPAALFARTATILWPEVMDFPVNRYGDIRDLFKFYSQLKKLGKRERVVRFLRARMAG